MEQKDNLEDKVIFEIDLSVSQLNNPKKYVKDNLLFFGLLGLYGTAISSGYRDSSLDNFNNLLAFSILSPCLGIVGLKDVKKGIKLGYTLGSSGYISGYFSHKFFEYFGI